MTDIQARIARLFIYPVKSCAGLELPAAELVETGFDLDRSWMVVDEAGDFVTQRDLPKMALIRPNLRHGDIVLRAPGMLALHLAVDQVESPLPVRLWGQEVPAWDMGAVAAQWFTDFLGRRLRLARFDPEHQRLSDAAWTGGVAAPNQFSDGFPLLVASEASLAGLNDRLLAQGRAAVGMERFRPNIVLSGLQAHDEDRLAGLRSEDGSLKLRLVKPCTRCSIPGIDPATAQVDPIVSDTLQSYRRDARMGGAVTFGMNAIVPSGLGQMLRVGQVLEGTWNFG